MYRTARTGARPPHVARRPPKPPAVARQRGPRRPAPRSACPRADRAPAAPRSASWRARDRRRARSAAGRRARARPRSPRPRRPAPGRPPPPGPPGRRSRPRRCTGRRGSAVRRRWRSATTISVNWRRRATSAGERPLLGVRERPGLGPDGLAEVRQHSRVDGVGLGELAGGTGEVADLAGVDDGDGHADGRELGRGPSLDAAGRLPRRRARRRRRVRGAGRARRSEWGEALGVTVGAGEVEGVERDVDADVEGHGRRGRVVRESSPGSRPCGIRALGPSRGSWPRQLFEIGTREARRPRY